MMARPDHLHIICNHLRFCRSKPTVAFNSSVELINSGIEIINSGGNAPFE
jgi:hypothetical protein